MYVGLVYDKSSVAGQMCFRWCDLRVYSGTPGWGGRRHLSRCLIVEKVTSPNPTRGTRIDPFEDWMGEASSAVVFVIRLRIVRSVPK
ncbi:hypothetical protein AVEN_156606-1 [Araneus ventricosus]|uniref:Uncharacterized protein n=1 Tax=Araneus ventricosus TaxID=182803 RepID=A0A4Y2I0F6_ARAVE|nr:hypothetical protein AVEN_156041-1 [Araneus ventricosus]GBM71324.1 hypothetical protein AVEN_156606-1 [Araneus ventricosus]